MPKAPTSGAVAGRQGVYRTARHDMSPDVLTGPVGWPGSGAPDPGSATLASTREERALVTPEPPSGTVPYRGTGQHQARGDATGAQGPEPTVQLLVGLPQLGKALATGGLHIYLHIEGVHREVPTAVDQAAYRIIEDALTNLVSHTPGGTATVTVHFHEHELYLSVVDHGWRQDSDGADNRGRAIIDLRERAASIGGALDVGSSTTGGCALVAHIPRSSSAPGGRSASG